MKRDEKEEVLDLALTACRKISNDKERGEVLCDISDIFLKTGQKEKSISLLKKALKCAERTSSGASKAMVLSKVSEIFIKIGDHDKASKLLNDAVERVEHVSFSVDHKAEALADIVGVMVNLGEEDKALKLARDISNNYGRSTALARIADSDAGKGKQERADALLKESLELAERIVFSLERRARTQAEIAGVMAKNGEENRALDIAERISFGEQKKNALEMIVKASVENLEPDRARCIMDESLAIARTIQTGYAKVLAYNEIARAMIKSGDEENIDKMIEESIRIAERISLPLCYKRVEAFSDIARTLVEAGEKIRAEKVLDRAWNISKGISKDFKRARALTKVAEINIRME